MNNISTNINIQYSFNLNSFSNYIESPLISDYDSIFYKDHLRVNLDNIFSLSNKSDSNKENYSLLEKEDLRSEKNKLIEKKNLLFII